MGICVITFSNTIRNGFVYDDFSVIAENPRVKYIQNIKHIFNLNYFKILDKGKQPAFGESSYRPVVTATYFLDAFLWKGKSWGCHISNFLLHVLNTLLLYSVLLRLLNSKKIPFLSALIFAVHPAVTEAVNAIAFREELLVVLFCLLSLYFLQLKSKWNKKTFNISMDLLCAFCYLIALFSKEMAIAFPMLLLIIFYFKRDNWKGNLFLFISIVSVTIYYLIMRFIVMDNPNKDILVYPGGTCLTNIYTIATVLKNYIILVFFPKKLIVDHQVDPKRFFWEPDVLFSIIPIVTIMSITIIMFIKKRSIPAFSILWFFVSLLPVINIVKIDNISAERYLYLPMIGISVLFGYIGYRLFLIRPKEYLLSLIAVICLYCSRSIVRNNDWKNSINLWKSTIKSQPNSEKAYSNLASIYFSKDNFKTAIKYYLKCLSLRNTAKDRYNLANCYRKIGDYQRAISEYYKAIEIEDGYAEVYNNLGLTLIEIGNLNEAESVLKKGLSYVENDCFLYENLGLVNDLKGNYDEAEKYIKLSMKSNSMRPSAYNKLALIYFKKKLPEKGLEVLIQGIEKFPDNPFFYKNLAVYYHNARNPEKEIYYWIKAHETEPDNQDTIISIIKFYNTYGDKKNALIYKNILSGMIYEK